MTAGTVITGGAREIVFQNVSKFYGEVLGVNRVDLTVPPGITGLVGPNGSGKTTLMNLMTGLIRPTQGRIRVLDFSPDQPDRLFRLLGYCTQYDSFPPGLSGQHFLAGYLRLHGLTRAESERLARRALERVNLVDAAPRPIAAYSKGMRQRIKLAQAIAHDPQVLVLDEPLNGLDPLARAEVIDLFQGLAGAGRHLIISSHILHEVDLISDQVVLLNNGYVVAEGDIQGVRGEMEEHPIQVLIRCDKPSLIASRIFRQDHVVQVRIHDDRQGLLVHTRDADSFYRMINDIVLEDEVSIEAVAPVDEDVQAVYQYLIGFEGEGT